MNNKRPNFKQAIYHIGTKEEFIKYSENLFSNDKIEYLRKQVSITFDYIFNYLKKGIFVSIKNNRLEVYLPFSSIYYKNIFSHLLKVGPNFKRSNEKWMKGYNNDVVALAKQTENKKLYKYQRDINKNIDQWYANNCFFRNTVYGFHNEGPNEKELSFKIDEGDKSVANFLELLIEVCYKVQLKDVNFFINPRDFPILKKDGTGPYDAIYSHDTNPIISADRSIFRPILSQSGSDQFMDLLIPNDDDIVRTLKIIGPSSGCVSHTKEPSEPVSWSLKKNVAVFRGSATGCSITQKSNKRIQLAILSKEYSDILDVSLTSLNYRLKKDPDSEYVDYIDENKIVSIDASRPGSKFLKIKDLVKKSFMTDEETSSYKYIIDVEGHVASFRLGRMFSLGSVILKIDGPWKVWFSDFIIGCYWDEYNENAHYIKVRTVSEIITVINFLNNNDVLVHKIAINGYNFFLKNLGINGLVSYTGSLLNSLK